MPVGPIELADVVGLDVALNVGRVLAGAFNRPVPEILVERVQQKSSGANPARASTSGRTARCNARPVRCRSSRRISKTG